MQHINLPYKYCKKVNDNVHCIIHARSSQKHQFVAPYTHLRHSIIYPHSSTSNERSLPIKYIFHQLKTNKLNTELIAQEDWCFTSAGIFFRHSDTNSFMGREKCSSNCSENTHKDTLSWKMIMHYVMLGVHSLQWNSVKYWVIKWTWGGFSRGMIKRTLMGWRSASGGSPFAISIAVIPRDQISACIMRNQVLRSMVIIEPIKPQNAKK